MIDIQVIPDWAMIQAAKRAGIHHTPAQIRAGQMAAAARPPFFALCEMILQHETAPVDRKMLCALEAASNADMSEVDWDTITAFTCVRAIELWEEGFGK